MNKLKEFLLGVVLAIILSILLLLSVTTYINVVGFQFSCNGRSNAIYSYPFGYDCWLK